MNRSVGENLTYAHLRRFSRFGVVAGSREQAAARDMMDKLRVKADAPSTEVWALSGGNQQKLLFGKWLVAPPKVFLADEPARGVDVGAKQAVYALIAELARDGMAMVVVSSELEEVTGLAHRILVMRRGIVVGEVSGDADHDEILTLAFGQSDGSGGRPTARVVAAVRRGPRLSSHIGLRWSHRGAIDRCRFQRGGAGDRCDGEESSTAVGCRWGQSPRSCSSRAAAAVTRSPEAHRPQARRQSKSRSCSKGSTSTRA